MGILDIGIGAVLRDKDSRIKSEARSLKRAVAVAANADASEAGPRTVADAVHERLRADLMAGRYAPGVAMRLEPLMARYGCGISPLREALSKERCVGP